ncbi:MAG: peptidylprolyl isomerase [Candidatus Woesearchaeota archaeon]|nr:peptidylprolyl isomerase [Candidatus Woesearchaeota archaeon]
MAIKKGDFVEIDYMGKLKETGEVFDVTSAEVAKQHKIYNPKAHYHSQIICVGEKQVVSGLDEALVNKEEKKTFTVDLTPEVAFGKKDPKLMQLVPLQTFHKQQINPFPGLQLNLNGTLGTVRSVSGGRVVVDFNHPLAGRAVSYEVTVKRLVTSDAEKLHGIIHTLFQRDIACTVQEHKAHIDLPLQNEMQKHVIDHIKRLIPALQEVTFSQSKQANAKSASQKQ